MLRFPTAPAVFLDFDGCLVDIAPTPNATQVPVRLPALLMRLKRATGGAVALVSGRPLADLKRMLPGVMLHMIGSHGAERALGRGRADLLPVDVAVLERLRQRASEVAVERPGVLVEQKPVAVGLHFRGAPEAQDYIEQQAAQLEAESPGFHIHRAKMMVELRPDGVGKGDAVDALMAEAPFRGRVPVMVGDDATDEPAFEVVNAYGGVSIRVGRAQTRATRLVNGPPQVRRALWHLAERLERG